MILSFILLYRPFRNSEVYKGYPVAVRQSQHSLQDTPALKSQEAA